jgi:crossover junction endodeoxyribonuclease RusA
VLVELIMPDNRRRDIDNYQKAALDALAHAGVYQDDCQIDELIVRRLHVEPPGAIDLTITEQ